VSTPGQEEDRSEGGGYGHRIERRSTRRVARRRKRVKRLCVAVLPAIVVIAGVVALLIILGGRAEDSSAATSGTTTSTVGATGQAQSASIIVAIEQEGTVPALVLLTRTVDGGIAIGLPGLTLVRTAEEGFPTAGDLYLHEKTDALTAGLNRDLGTDLKTAARISWVGLLKALEQAGSTETWPTSLDSDAVGAIEAAGAFLSMAGLSASASGSGAWERMEVSGDAPALRTFVTEVAKGISAGSWSRVALPGRVVESVDSKYYEADTAAAKSLLKGDAASVGTGDITLEIQNGSGALDAAQSAGAMLESLGYKMLPFQNAEDFPNVNITTISAPPDALVEAEKVRGQLGVGMVSEDDSLASGHVRVVVGKDFTPSTTGG
jgi:hypothetical protein